MYLEQHLKKIRTLTLFLFISGTLNIILSALLVHFYFKEPSPPYFGPPSTQQAQLKTAQASPSSSKLLAAYKTKPYEQLISHLWKTGPVEDPFSERDLALSILTSFHDFDLERALGGNVASLQKRCLQFNEGQDKVIVYPNLSKGQYESICTFAKTEKWPFKARGLFHLLNKEHFKEDTSLHDAFYMTKEFASFESLLKGYKVSKEEILQLVREGEWGLLSSFHEKERLNPDPSPENRQKWLLTYMKEGSSAAASILLVTDFDFALKRLSDSALMKMVPLLEKNTSETSRFLSFLAASPRADTLKALAIAKYAAITGKPWEPLVSRETSIPLDKVVAWSPPPAASLTPQVPQKKGVKKDLLYVVQDGDTLWKVAKRFKVTVDEIQKLNSLKSATIKPGVFLLIPNKD